MKSSPTNGGWWERFKEAVRSLPDPNPTLTPDEPWPRLEGPINHTAPGRPIPIGIKRADGTFFIGTSADLKIPDVEDLLRENAKLLAANEDLRYQLAGAKTNERKLAWRIEAFRKKWPAIHKDFFTAKGKNNEL